MGVLEDKLRENGIDLCTYPSPMDGGTRFMFTCSKTKTTRTVWIDTGNYVPDSYIVNKLLKELDKFLEEIGVGR